ncbi:MAG: dTDP-4-dehydrorhamnose 3,5-epimerase [Planctomycetota bacterium]|nr:dTDP-4-dehydrorhamnose 3,5-epimerase [Planctomycetota bacterium]
MSEGDTQAGSRGEKETRFIPQALPEVILIEPALWRDERGYFLESYNTEAWQQAGIPEFIQDNHSSSGRGVLRGLHAQLRQPQGKLVRVIEGEIYDVAVDIRPSSPGFGKWVAVHLSADNFRQLYIPPGFAHGFCVAGDQAQVLYKVTSPYDPADEITIAWNDPQLAIDWPLSDPVLSEKDAAGDTLADLADRLPGREVDS